MRCTKKKKKKNPKFYLTSTFPVCKNTETWGCQMRQVFHPMGGCISNCAERQPTHAGNATQEKSQHSDFSGEPRFSRSELSAVLRDFSITLSKEFSVSDVTKAPARSGSHRGARPTPGPSLGPVLQTNGRQEEKNDPNSRRSSLRPAPGLEEFQRSPHVKDGIKLTVTSARCGTRPFPEGSRWPWGGEMTGGVSALRQGRPRTGQTPAPDTPGPGTGQTPGPRTEQTPTPALGKHGPRTHPAPSRRGAAPRPSPARPPRGPAASAPGAAASTGPAPGPAAPGAARPRPRPRRPSPAGSGRCWARRPRPPWRCGVGAGAAQAEAAAARSLLAAGSARSRPPRHARPRRLPPRPPPEPPRAAGSVPGGGTESRNSRGLETPPTPSSAGVPHLHLVTSPEH